MARARAALAEFGLPPGDVDAQAPAVAR